MYIVIELQTTNNKTATIINDFEDRQEAESKYHSVLSAAAVSKVPIHAATLLADTGEELLSGCYYHEEETNETESN